MAYFVFAGGGTGGHLFPALGVVEKLRGLNDDAMSPVDVAFFCTQKQIDADILGKAGVRAMPLSVRAFPRRPWQVPGFYWRWRESVSQCLRHFRERRPAAVIGAGGYASGPPVHAAMKLGIPTFLLNPDAVPGRANLHMGAKGGIKGVFAQWDVTREYFPTGTPVFVTGCPVRGSFLDKIGASGIRLTQDESQSSRVELAGVFDLEARRRTLLVTGASQGARTINDAMILLAPVIAAAGWQVLHLAGTADAEKVRVGYAQAKTAAKVLTFTDRMPEAMMLSDLIISRAGASSLAEILAVGRASVLLPYPFHRDQHQRHNAEVLVEAGAGIVMDDTKDGALNAKQLEPLLRGLLSNDGRRERMAAAAAQLGRPAAARDMATMLMNVAAGRAVDAGDATPMTRAA